MLIYKSRHYHIATFYIMLLFLYFSCLHANTQPNLPIIYIADTLYHSMPADSTKEITLPKDPDTLQMQQEQIDLMRKEFHGNRAPSDLLYYKQDEIQKQIQKDSTLKIKPEHTTQTDIIGTTAKYEFIMQYFFKIVNEIPYGEDYKISIPLHTLGLEHKGTPARTCTINTKQHSLALTLYNHYTKVEMQASIRKQTQYLLYNLLQEYKTEVLECLMLNQAYLDDMNTALNLQSHTKTITSVRSYVLVDFHGGILTLQVFNPPHKKQ